MKQKGFTLIELIVCVVILGLLAIIVFSQASGSSSISWGINGMTEERCIGGYKHVIGEGGQARQIMDEHGKGIRCQ